MSRSGMMTYAQRVSAAIMVINDSESGKKHQLEALESLKRRAKRTIDSELLVKDKL